MSDPIEAGKTPTPVTPAVTPIPAAPAAPAAPVEISLETFQQLALRIGTITAAELHPKADRLLVLTVDIGEAAPRQVVAGIRQWYQPAELIGRQVVVVANLKPAALRGVMSQGMVLAGSDETGLALLHPAKPLRPGSTVK
jgi:methionyl-tRNA synthetase